MNVDAATKALNLYADFYGQADPGEFPDNACTFNPPAPFGQKTTPDSPAAGSAASAPHPWATWVRASRRSRTSPSGAWR